MRTRVKWISLTASGALVAEGTTVSCYAFRCTGTGLAEFRTGGAAGGIISTCRGTAEGSDSDDLGGSGNFIEVDDGVYVTITGTPDNAAVLVDYGTVAA